MDYRTSHLTQALINLDHLTHNMGLLQALVGTRPLWPAIKANAYGHGAELVGRHLVSLGYTTLCVAHVAEAIELVQAGVHATFVVLSATLPERSDEIVAYGFEPVVCTLDMIEGLARAAARTGKQVAVHLKVDTGMGRIGVRLDEKVKLRILNAGTRTLSLHTHGHHPILTHLDGYAVPPAMRYARDVFTIGPAQRVDLELRTTPDAHYASGPGVWFMHDHTEQAVTNKGISPGGDLTVIVYEAFMGSDGLPRTAMNLERFFNPDYYAGKLPVFDPAIFHTTLHDYPPLAGGKASEGTALTPDDTVPAPAEPQTHGHKALHQHTHSERLNLLDEHRPIARSCARPLGSRRVVLREGSQVAEAGEVYGFAPQEIHVGRCEEVEVVLENTDAIRHALMIPGLNPMFMLEFQAPGVQTGRFITPDEDITLPFHCHVPTHAKMGMEGVFIVGKGGTPKAKTVTATVPTRFEGIGTVIVVDARKGQLVVDHEEIPGFMAAMIMGYPVQAPTLLHELTAGDRIRFTIDAQLQVITQITKLDNGSSKTPNQP